MEREKREHTRVRHEMEVAHAAVDLAATATRETGGTEPKECR
jgi:hypothetical protein